MKNLYLHSVAALLCATGLAACGGSGNGNLTLGGTVTGLSKPGVSLVLSNNGTSTVTIAASTSTAPVAFVFPTLISSNSSYEVKIVDPKPDATVCTVTGGSGKASTSNITSIAVACVTTTHKLGGTVTGLAGSNLVLANGSDHTTISANGEFTFPTEVADGSPYIVKVLTPPSDGKTCSVTNGDARMGSSDVGNVLVDCL